MCDTGRINDSCTLEFDGSPSKAIEQTHTATDEDGRHVNVYFIDQPGLKSLLQNIGGADHHVLISGGFFCLTDGAFNTIGDKDEWRVFFHPFLRNMVGHNESRRTRLMATPGVNDIKGSASPYACSDRANSSSENLSTLFGNFKRRHSFRHVNFGITAEVPIE